MSKKGFITIVFVLAGTAAALGQGAPHPPQGPPRGGQGGPPMGNRQGPPQQDWFKDADTNRDGKFDASELQTALDTTFAEIDRNSNGMIDANEMPHPPKGQRAPEGGRPQGPPPGGQGMAPNGPPMGGQPGQFAPNGGPGKKLLPPFFFADRSDEATSISRADFDRIAHRVFTEMDKNGDGVLSKEETRPPKRPDAPNGPPEGMAPPPPNGQFIAAELRFGDRLVKGQPFSAETVMEDTRRLFDGNTVTKSSHGAIYRDNAGRTRREQPLELIGGVNISGADGKPTTLVFINDFDSRTQYFLDVKNKVARKHGIAGDAPGEPPMIEDAKTESLGTKTIEGVQAEGTRITFEIPAGRLGNDKPIQVVTENWFSPELQMMILSRHVDPLAGEHVFKLMNIKRGEQSADMFTVPSDFKVEGPDRQKRPE
jgi:hypothetical protein